MTKHQAPNKTTIQRVAGAYLALAAEQPAFMAPGAPCGDCGDTGHVASDHLDEYTWTAQEDGW